MPCISFPHISWWVNTLRDGQALTLYTGKPFRKLSYRNRYRIASANGPLRLSIPLQGGRRKGLPLGDTEIDYTHDWQRQHWGALYSAYGRAPFYEHYGPELEALIFAGHRTLLDFNLAGINWICKVLRLEPIIALSGEWDPGWADEYSKVIRPAEAGEIRPYHQVFGDKQGFIPDLSIIDLLMAEGPYATAYLFGGIKNRT